MAESERPALSPNLTGAEFSHWYWLKTELTVFARQLQIRTSGSKETLTARIKAALDGRPFDEPLPTTRPSPSQLTGTVTQDSVIPKGQRCSRVVREWFVSQVGPGFRFDGPMRQFFAQTEGTQTLGDALSHYLTTRSKLPLPIASQFEFNRFTRDWYRNHPETTRREMLSAWQEYRSLPKDHRTSTSSRRNGKRDSE